MKQMMNWIKENKWSAAGILIILLAIVVGTVRADIDPCMTGSWYDPTTDDGRGIDIQVLESGIVAGYFYTWYGAERELVTIIGTNDADLEVTFDAYQSLFEGSHWVGNAWIDVVDNDHIVFSYNWRHDFRRVDNTMRWCFYDCDGVYEYPRLTQPIACD